MVGTATAIIGFWKLTSPFRELFSLSTKFNDNLIEIQENFQAINKRFDEIWEAISETKKELINIKNNFTEIKDVQLALLHDAIIQICDISKMNNKVDAENYKRACELYKMNGNSPYVETRMQELTAMYLHQQKLLTPNDISKDLIKEV